MNFTLLLMFIINLKSKLKINAIIYQYFDTKFIQFEKSDHAKLNSLKVVQFLYSISIVTFYSTCGWIVNEYS